MKSISLNGIWQIKGKSEFPYDTESVTLNGKVPGCVQLDLSENGYLPKDLYMGKNILEAEKYECFEWWYERKFELKKAENNTFLVFEGVDCIAEYFLNGKKIGESNNMFIAHEFKIDEYIHVTCLTRPRKSHLPLSSSTKSMLWAGSVAPAWAAVTTKRNRL